MSTLIFTLMFSATRFAECTKVFVCNDGNTCFVDFERIRKHDGFFYYWHLVDHFKSSETWTLSLRIYQQGIGIRKINNDLTVGVSKIFKIMDAA